MGFSIPHSATEYGFRLKPGGAHGSKTMMLREVRLLFAASRPESSFEELQRLVVEENVLLKDTFSNREDVFKRLSDLYGLRSDVLLYRVLRSLWDTSEQEQPLLALQGKLKAIADGEPPHDIYVRWKPLHQQPLGWDPDINDGVRLNIRPFVTAGILRSKFPVNWNKDRGTNPDGSERLNDIHLTRAQKESV